MWINLNGALYLISCLVRASLHSLSSSTFLSSQQETFMLFIWWKVKFVNRANLVALAITADKRLSSY